MTSDEIKKLRLDKFQVELEIKKVELLEKKKEAEKSGRIRKKITIEQATILVAIIGFIGSFLGNFLQGYYAQKQKSEEFQSNLITKAVETGNSKQSKENLKFLLDAGLIKDPENKIKDILIDSTYKINFVSSLNLIDSLQETDLESVVNQICNTIGVKPNFVLVPKNISAISVYATISDGKRMLVYNPEFVQNIRTTTKTNWSVVMVLAHECSHHLLGHILTNDVTPGLGNMLNNNVTAEQSRQYELEADQSAGFILAKMGATLEETESVLKSLKLSEDSLGRYPAKSSRLIAAERGWNSANINK